MPSTKKSEEFCIARLVSEVGLVQIAAMSDLHAAKVYVKKLTAHTAGEYVVYRRNDGGVVAKTRTKISHR
jgi:hypothetical protein